MVAFRSLAGFASWNACSGGSQLPHKKTIPFEEVQDSRMGRVVLLAIEAPAYLQSDCNCMREPKWETVRQNPISSRTTRDGNELLFNSARSPPFGMGCWVVIDTWIRPYKQMSGWFCSGPMVHEGGVTVSFLTCSVGHGYKEWNNGLTTTLSVSFVGPAFAQCEDPLACPGITPLSSL